jgi:hypothetical protein
VDAPGEGHRQRDRDRHDATTQGASGGITVASQEPDCPFHGHHVPMRCQRIRTHEIQVSREKSKTNVADELLKGLREVMHMTTATQGGGSF